MFTTDREQRRIFHTLIPDLLEVATGNILNVLPKRYEMSGIYYSYRISRKRNVKQINPEFYQEVSHRVTNDHLADNWKPTQAKVGKFESLFDVLQGVSHL